ncbi:hypothetical protein GALMADRAFT_242628 [Galerina marginata CBS 339.88]|uniref:Amine oxidase domain-containing protein n=1 Tax=Galerina marginata (strain CBS 339.88) TaxID=685588 RepID=A0A067TMU7_GALM3|nr:hypothetical protein GALMADRAFT_242628 [Galerina marginata CBS 339.88]
MRFPKIRSMQRVFNLFDYAPLNTPDIALGSKVHPFVFQCDNTFLSYNGVTVQGSPPPYDVFKSSEVIQDTNPQPYIQAGTKAIVNDVISPFASGILQDLGQDEKPGWDYMMRFDSYSTRAYMSIAYEPSEDLGIPPCPLPTDVVNWCETFETSTGWYDRALSETVLEAIAFGWQPGPDPPSVEWYCINDGVQEIAECMAKYIRNCDPNAISLNSRVTSTSYRNTPGNKGVDVGIANNCATQQFTHVVSTIPLPVLRTVDLDAAGLDPMQSNALRQLNYGPAIKVGLQFKEAWWFTKFQIVGGQSFTDRPIRTIVYPSFGDVENGMTTTLIASYCWTEDASRMGALIDDKDGDEQLKDLVLRDLADIHDLTVDYLREQLIECKAWSWSHNPYTMGAYAFFGPGKFQNPYTSLNTPAANGFLHFAGEAISVRHAWVEGALDSAWRAVREMLYFSGFTDEQRQRFFDNWGANEEWVKQDDDLLFKHLAHMKPELFDH